MTNCAICTRTTGKRAAKIKIVEEYNVNEERELSSIRICLPCARRLANENIADIIHTSTGVW